MGVSAGERRGATCSHPTEGTVPLKPSRYDGWLCSITDGTRSLAALAPPANESESNTRTLGRDTSRSRSRAACVAATVASGDVSLRG